MQGTETELVKRNPEGNQARFYRLAIWPDLFGGFSLAREYGRIGQPGLLRLDPYPEEEQAKGALHKLVRRKTRRGYAPPRRQARMSAETATIHYSRITERRAKAVQLDIGEKKPVWFPLHRITLDEANYTVTVPQALLTEKRAAAQGAPIKRDPRDFERVKLPEPAWENDRSIRIDVIVSGLSGRGKVRKSLFFPKSQIEDGTAPRWLVEKKQKDVVQEVAASRRCPESQLIVRPFTETGLLAEASAAPEAPEAEPQELRRIAQQAFQP